MKSKAQHDEEVAAIQEDFRHLLKTKKVDSIITTHRTSISSHNTRAEKLKKEASQLNISKLNSIVEIDVGLFFFLQTSFLIHFWN